jgi:ParB family protein of integrating conjugative element (PFGI_1 class)
VLIPLLIKEWPVSNKRADLRAAIHEQMNKPTTSLAPKNPAELVGEGTSIIRLAVADVDPYEDNPRHGINPLYEEIRDSIEAKGLESILTVVRRPGSNRYVLSKGGKTRLTALKELAQTNPKFEYQDFKIQKYVSESDILGSHLVENLQRSDMSFWDTARGIVKMRDTLVIESGQPISRAELNGKLKSLGVVIDENLPNESAFAVEFFSTLGSLADSITRNDLRKVLRPQFNQLEAFWLKHPSFTKEQFEQHYRDWVAMYQTQNDSYDVGTLTQFIQFELASALDYEDQTLADLLQLTASPMHKSTSLEDLRALIVRNPEPFPDTASTLVPDAHTAAGQSSTDPMDPGLARLAQSLSSGSFKPQSDPGIDEGEGDEGQGATPYFVDSAPGFGGVPGLEVIEGSKLVPRTTAPSSAQAETGQQQAGFSTMDPKAVFTDAINAFIEMNGLEAFVKTVTPNQCLRTGLLIEPPPEGQAFHPDDVQSHQAWWIVAWLTGQMNISPEVPLPESEFANIFNQENFAEVLEKRVGSIYTDAGWLLEIITNPMQPLSDATSHLVNSLRQVFVFMGGNHD